VLLDEVKDSWISNCLYHNTAASPSLYLNHNCEREDFPTKSVLDLKNHYDEVWFVKYSNDGTKLASTSKDTTIIIYETNTYKVLHHLKDHLESGVTHLAWSPDDTKIVTCCSQPENSARIWDVKVCASSLPKKPLLTFPDWQVYNVYQRFHIPLHDRSMGAFRQICRYRFPG
jgi:WD40 repeat protein